VRAEIVARGHGKPITYVEPARRNGFGRLQQTDNGPALEAQQQRVGHLVWLAHPHRHTHTHTVIHTERCIDIRTHIDRERDGHTCRHTHKHTHGHFRFPRGVKQTEACVRPGTGGRDERTRVDTQYLARSFKSHKKSSSAAFTSLPWCPTQTDTRGERERETGRERERDDGCACEGANE
jgi:hypothetical protein